MFPAKFLHGGGIVLACVLMVIALILDDLSFYKYKRDLELTTFKFKRRCGYEEYIYEYEDSTETLKYEDSCDGDTDDEEDEDDACVALERGQTWIATGSLAAGFAGISAGLTLADYYGHWATDFFAGVLGIVAVSTFMSDNDFCYQTETDSDYSEYLWGSSTILMLCGAIIDCGIGLSKILSVRCAVSAKGGSSYFRF